MKKIIRVLVLILIFTLVELGLAVATEEFNSPSNSSSEIID